MSTPRERDEIESTETTPLLVDAGHDGTTEVAANQPSNELERTARSDEEQASTSDEPASRTFIISAHTLAISFAILSFVFLGLWYLRDIEYKPSFDDTYLDPSYGLQDNVIGVLQISFGVIILSIINVFSLCYRTILFLTPINFIVYPLLWLGLVGCLAQVYPYLSDLLHPARSCQAYSGRPRVPPEPVKDPKCIDYERTSLILANIGVVCAVFLATTIVFIFAYTVRKAYRAGIWRRIGENARSIRIPTGQLAFEVKVTWLGAKELRPEAGERSGVTAALTTERARPAEHGLVRVEEGRTED